VAPLQSSHGSFAQQGVRVIIECGPGEVLSKLVKRIDPAIKAISIQEPGKMQEANQIIIGAEQ